jgi:DNA polymerase elongation subunit (family B)
MEEYSILLNKNVQAAASFVRSSLMKLVDGDVPIEQLIISKTLRGSYVNPSIVHAARKTHARTRPRSAPQINDRVQYAFVVTDNPKLFSRVEDPKFIQENKLPLDYAFYIKSQITEPVNSSLSWSHGIDASASEPSETKRPDLFQPALDKIAQRDPCATCALFRCHVDLFSTSTCK